MTRAQLLQLATLVQGLLAIASLGLAWLVGINPFDRVQLTSTSAALGIFGTIPMLLVFTLTYRSRLRPFREIRDFLTEALGPTLAECRWYDLAWIAFLAGYSEELLFRGVLHAWLNHWGSGTGLLVSNALFAAVHAVTPTYALLAGLQGMILGCLFEYADPGNLLVPILAHTLYDLIALEVVRRGFLRQLPSVEAVRDDVQIEDVSEGGQRPN